jgi:hypothetical protein
MKHLFVFIILLFSAWVTCTGQLLKKGSKVQAKMGTFWTDATIVEVKGSQYKIHFDGYGEAYDEWVSAGQMQNRSNDTEKTTIKTEKIEETTPNFTIGEKVEVWNTIWYPAIVTEITNGLYKVDYYDWTGYPDEWVKDDRIKKFGSTKEYKAATTSNNRVTTPEMGGNIPNIVGTSWAVITIYEKGTTPTFDRMDNYIFCKSGHWEYQANAIANRGVYKIQGNQLTITEQGNKTATYKISWNEAGSYLELDDGVMIIRLKYNMKTTC